MDGLARNLARVQGRIAAACQAAGRQASEVQLVCVTKSCSPAVARRLATLGADQLGENRVAQLERKQAAFAHGPAAVTWHYLGHVQRNKARRVVQLSDVIHSVDSARLLEALERVAEEEGRRPGIYLQVKLTDEETKTGLAPAHVPQLVERAGRAGALPLLGLMAMAPQVEGTGERVGRQARQTFDALAALARSLPADAFASGRVGLSMGMSADLEQAIAAGATVVRVGGALFEGIDRDPRPHEEVSAGE